MKVYRLSRGTITERGITTIGEVDLTETGEGRFVTRSNTRVKGMDEPYIDCKIIVYSKTKDTRKIDKLCEKIRKAVEEYNK